MSIQLSGEAQTGVAIDNMTPRQIVAELDKYVVGQRQAKRAVAIALRNRWRRQQLPPELGEEIAPKNILMIGPTGVGKTEIARRLARLAKAPFLKVEASKFTEVGYVGRDVESMVRDLVEIAVTMVKEEKREAVREAAVARAEDRLLQLLVPPRPINAYLRHEEENEDELAATREKFREKLRGGALDHRRVEIEVDESAYPSLEMFTPQRVEEVGLIFLDEIDKIAGREGGRGPDISREGVQRDLLPIVEGTNVSTKYGMVKTDHILFIAAGAFHVSKPSDLIPELQGRFPIRVELDSLTLEDFKRILTEPKNSLVKQYKALLETEGIELDFTEDAIDALARFAVRVNEQTENIGARRLHTIMEKVLDEISFEGPDLEPKRQLIDAEYVGRTISDIVKDQDLSRYVL